MDELKKCTQKRHHIAVNIAGIVRYTLIEPHPWKSERIQATSQIEDRAYRRQSGKYRRIERIYYSYSLSCRGMMPHHSEASLTQQNFVVRIRSSSKLSYPEGL